MYVYHITVNVRLDTHDRIDMTFLVSAANSWIAKAMIKEYVWNDWNDRSIGFGPFHSTPIDGVTLDSPVIRI
jgi:hypothetical protein